MRPLAGVVVLVLVAAGLATRPSPLGATAPVLPNAAGQWTATTIDGAGGLQSVSCPSSQFCAAVDEQGNVVTLGPSGWSTPSSITSGSLTSVSCPTASFCVAVDLSGEAIAFAQGSWRSPTSVDPGGSLVSVSCPSTTFCLAADATGDVTTFDGTAWSTPVDVDPGYTPSGVSCSSATLCELVDAGGNVLTMSGTAWSTAVGISGRAFFGISCPTASFCAAYGASGVELFDGTHWTSPYIQGLTFQSVSCPSASSCTFDTSGGPYTYANGTWSGYAQALGSGTLTSISCASASTCVTVGDGQAYSYGGGAVGALTSVDSHPFTGVSCGSSQFCLAVDSSGGAVPYTAPTWGSVQDVDGTNPLTGVSCVGQWCLAVDSRGNAVTDQAGVWSAPTAVSGVADFTGVSCVAIGSCVAIDTTGSVLTLNGSTWSAPLDIDGTTSLESVACATPTSCIVSDQTDPGHAFVLSGTQWSPAELADAMSAVLSLSCPTTTYCTGVDGNGEQVQFNGSQWSGPTQIRGTDATTISCSTPGSCAASGLGMNLSFSDGADWTYPQILGVNNVRATGISCVPSLCADVDSDGAASIIYDAGPAVTAGSGPGGSVGALVTLSASVSSPWAPQARPTGTVTFLAGGTALCTATLTAGSGSCSTTAAPAGTDVVIASYGGDSAHLAATAPPFLLTVTPSPNQPEVSRVGPTNGCAVGGSQVTITGVNLTGVTAVEFGTTTSPDFSVTGPTSMIATVPPGSGTVDVTVTGPAGSSPPTVADQFTYGPTVTGISSSGSALGGDTVVVSGTGFTGATAIDIGGVPATSFQVTHDWLASAVTPPESGSLDVTVTARGCSSQVTAADRYQAWPIVTSIAPATGTTAGGTTVTLTGAGFTGVTAVDFGNLAAPSFHVVSDSEITAVTPAPLQQYKQGAAVTVVTAMGAGRLTDATFLYDPFPSSGTPTISSFSPSSVREGTTVTITGTNLGDTTNVEFGTLPASFTIVSGTTVTAVVPAGATTGTVTVAGSNGTTTSTQMFTVTGPSTVLPGGSCWQVLIDPSLSHVYVTCGSTVSVFDESGVLLATIPNLPQADSMVLNGSHLYVHMRGTGSIADVDTRSLTVGQTFAAGITGATSMVLADGRIWAVSGGQLDAVDPSTGQTTAYTGMYEPDLASTGLRSDPANPNLIYDFGAFSTIDVSQNPPSITRPQSLTGLQYAISGATDGTMTPDGRNLLVDDGSLTDYGVDDPFAPVSQFVEGLDNYTAVAMTGAVDGGLVAAGVMSSGLTPIELFGLAGARPLAAVSLGDVDSSIPAQCLAFSPDGSTLFAVSTLDGTARFHAVPVSLPAAAPAFTSSATASVVTGEPSSLQVTTSGTPASTLTESGALPAGLTFSPGADGSASITGTPTASGGTSVVHLTATNATGTVSQDLAITVDPVPTVTSPAAATLPVSTPGYVTLSASGTPSPSFRLSGTLPTGLVLTDYGDGTASISGSPDLFSGGVYPLTLTVSNAAGSTSSQTFILTISGPPGITSQGAGQVVEGSAAELTVTSAGWPLPTLTESGNLPTGLHFTDNGNGTATFRGTAALGTAGSYPLRLTSANSSSSSTQNYTLTVARPPTVTSASQANFTDGQFSSYTVTTSAYPVAAVSLVGALPPGLTAASGSDGTMTIAGAPAKSDTGVYPLYVHAANGVGSDALQALTVYTAPVGSARPNVIGSTSFTFHVGKNAKYRLAATGSPTPTMSVDGTLPAGLTSSLSGKKLSIAGRATADAVGNYALTVHATNAAGTTSQSVLITVVSTPTFTSVAQATFSDGVPNQFAVITTGGYPGPTSLSVVGSLPSGVTFVDSGGGAGTLSGTPTGTLKKTYAVKLLATNDSGTTTQKFRLNLVPRT